MTTGAIGSIGSLTEEQQAVCKHLPQPIAAAWQEVLLARTHAVLEQKLLRLVDVIARTLGVLTLTDYLRGPPARQVEQLLTQLEDPEPEVWFSLLNAAVDAIYARTQPKPFCLELLVWAHGPRGEAAKGQRLLEKALEVRQDLLTHTDTLNMDETGTAMERLLGICVSLCESLSWLALFRLVHPTSLETLRGRGFSGKIQVLMGGAEVSPAVDATWTAHLMLDGVYWCAPDATAFLEVSPLMRVLPHPRLKRSQCFLFAGAPHLRRLQLRHDSTEVTLETVVTVPGTERRPAEWTFAEWLSHRDQHHALLENVDLTGALAVDHALVRRPPTRRPPSRPIPDLSADAFREPTGWKGRHPSSVQSPARTRQKQAVLIAQVVVLIAIVLAGARMLKPAAGRHQAVHIDERGVAAVVAKTRGGPGDSPPAALPAPPSPSAAELLARAKTQEQEVRMQAAQAAFAAGELVAATQPVFAVLKWEVAAYLGDWHGDRALARLLVRETPLPKTRCRRHTLRALTAQPGDGELTLVATKCGVKSGEKLHDDIDAWRYDLRARLISTAQKLVAGAQLADVSRRAMARSLLADAGTLGSPGAWIQLAKLAWESDRLAGPCRDALAEARKLGDLSPTDLTVLGQLTEACKP